MRRLLLALAVLLAVVAFLLLPHKVTVAPDWEIRVLDQNHQPLTGALVEERAVHWDLDAEHADYACTGVSGSVRFSRYQVQTTRFELLVGAVRNLINPHGSSGPRVSAWADRLGYGEMEDKGNIADWKGRPDPMHSTFVLQQCRQGFTGYRCNFDYDYYFGINGASAKRIAACQSTR